MSGIKMKDNKLIDSNKPILPISTVAQALNIHQRTLRIYDKEAILCPARTSKNRRMYTFQDFEKAKVIVFMTRNLALNIAAVKLILAIFEQEKIEISQYQNYLDKIAKLAKMDAVVQEDNKEKASKKGRKAKVK